MIGQVDELQEENKNFKKSIVEKDAEIETAQLELKITKEAFHTLKGKVSNFRDVLDTIFFQLNFMKARAKELRHTKDDYDKDDQNLKARAAAGFEELTPRPKYKQIMQERNVDLNFRTEANFASKLPHYFHFL